MRRRSRSSPWAKAFGKGLAALTRRAVRAVAQSTRRAIKASLPQPGKVAQQTPLLGAGGASGAGRASRAPKKTAATATRGRTAPVSARSASTASKLAPVPAQARAKAKATPPPAPTNTNTNTNSTSSPRRRPPAGDWLVGTAAGSTGARRFRLYRPPGVLPVERLPVLVMLHGCGQDAQGFADSTRMNAVARRERFLVLYPEQDRLSNAHGCWNWFETRNGRASAELAIILLAIDQVCLLHRGDPARVAVAGLSAGASMAALLASRHPARVCAVVMHSGVGPGAAHSVASALAAMRGLRQPTAPSAGPLAASGAGQVAADAREQGFSRGDDQGADQAPTSVALPPLLAIQGGVDRVVSAGNAAAVVRVWAEAAGARMGVARTVQRGQRHPMTITTCKRRSQTVATLVEIGALGHAWSGGSARLPYGDGQGADASRMVWAFVARAMREAQQPQPVLDSRPTTS